MSKPNKTVANWRRGRSWREAERVDAKSRIDAEGKADGMRTKYAEPKGRYRVSVRSYKLGPRRNPQVMWYVAVYEIQQDS